MHNPLPKLEISDFPAIRRKALDTLQVNLISVDWRGFVYDCDFIQIVRPAVRREFPPARPFEGFNRPRPV